MRYGRSLLTLAAAFTVSAAAPPPDSQTINVVWLPPGQTLPKTPEDIRDERVRDLLEKAGFAGTLGISDAHHFSTNDTIPVRLSHGKAPAGSLQRDQPLVGEIMRLDQQLMAQGHSIFAGSAVPLQRLDAPFVGTDRQFDFTAQLAGCAEPMRITGSVAGRGRRQLLNLMLPERKISVVLSIDDENFDAGNLEQGTGFLPKLLSLVACS